MRRRKIRVIYKKLGKEKCWGQANLDDNTVELDPRLKGKKHMEILIHESVHILFPELEEEDVVKTSVALTKVLWGEDYRRVEEDNSTPLQDGSL